LGFLAFCAVRFVFGAAVLAYSRINRYTLLHSQRSDG